MLVVVSGTSLAKIFEHPGLPLATVDVGFRGNPSRITELSEADIRSRSTAQEDWSIRVNMFGVKALEMSVDDTIHRTAESFARFDSAVRQPAPLRLLFDFPVWCLAAPADISPQDRLVESRGSPDST